MDLTKHASASRIEISKSGRGGLSKRLLLLQELYNRFGLLRAKEEVIHAFEHTNLLHTIPLDSPEVQVEQAHKDFRRERVLFNDVPFIPDKHDVNRCHAFSFTLQTLVERMMRNKDCYNSEVYPSAESISDTIMCRACRTSAGADSFFMVQKLLCVEGHFVTQRASLKDPPIHLDVFISDSSAHVDRMEHGERRDQHSANGHAGPVSFAPAIALLNPVAKMPERSRSLCCRIQVTNSFAIYDADSIEEITGEEELDPPPWLEVEAIVTDESNFLSLGHWRWLQLVVSCPATGKVYNFSDTESRRNSGRSSSGRLSERLLHEITSWFTASSSGSNHNSYSHQHTLHADHKKNGKTHSYRSVAAVGELNERSGSFEEIVRINSSDASRPPLYTHAREREELSACSEIDEENLDMDEGIQDPQAPTNQQIESNSRHSMGLSRRSSLTVSSEVFRDYRSGSDELIDSSIGHNTTDMRTTLALNIENMDEASGHSGMSSQSLGTSTHKRVEKKFTARQQLLTSPTQGSSKSTPFSTEIDFNVTSSEGSAKIESDKIDVSNSYYDQGINKRKYEDSDRKDVQEKPRNTKSASLQLATSQQVGTTARSDLSSKVTGKSVITPRSSSTPPVAKLVALWSSNKPINSFDLDTSECNGVIPGADRTTSSTYTSEGSICGGLYTTTAMAGLAIAPSGKTDGHKLERNNSNSNRNQ